jgi:phosphonate transport system ATP-binding protein
MRRSEGTDAAGAHVLVRGLGLERGGRWLFREVTLDVPQGAFVAVVGPSGVGKTSFLGCLAGRLEPTAGQVLLRAPSGEPRSPSALQNRLGIIFQGNLLVSNTSLLTNVLCGRLGRYPWWRTLRGFPEADRARALAVMTDLGLGPLVHRWVCETSGGEQQRTAVARALFQEPDLYFADEPVSNLDTYLSGRVLGLLRGEAQRGRTVFCVLHNPDLVERFADWSLSFDPADARGWKLREVRR